MLEFYRDVLGLPVAKHNESLGLWHLQAGDSMIDLININGPLGRDGLLPSTKAQNVDHLALKITPFDSDALRAYFEAHGVEVGPDRIRFGANGDGPSIHLRDPEGHWFALTQRGRAIYASKDRVAEGEITSYEDLADPKWEGKICTRSGTHVYNVALFASMIAVHGEEKAKEWLEGLKNNLARKPQGNDRAQVKAIKEGVCDVAIGNTYYYGKMLDNEEQRPWAESVNIVFPNQADRGMSMNISGMSLIKDGPNRENAVKLMEFLTGDVAQQIYAEVNYEYPVKPGVEWAENVKSWGTFKADELPLSDIARLSPDAIKLVDTVGYNE